jgi:hypothetical protein
MAAPTRYPPTNSYLAVAFHGRFSGVLYHSNPPHAARSNGTCSPGRAISQPCPWKRAPSVSRRSTRQAQRNHAAASAHEAPKPRRRGAAVAPASNRRPQPVPRALRSLGKPVAGAPHGRRPRLLPLARRGRTPRPPRPPRPPNSGLWIVLGAVHRGASPRTARAKAATRCGPRGTPRSGASLRAPHAPHPAQPTALGPLPPPPQTPLIKGCRRCLRPQLLRRQQVRAQRPAAAAPPDPRRQRRPPAAPAPSGATGRPRSQRPCPTPSLRVPPLLAASAAPSRDSCAN